MAANPTKGREGRKGWKLNLYAISRSSAFSQRGQPKKEYFFPVQGTDFDSAIPFRLVLGRLFFPELRYASTPPIMLIDARFLDYFARLERWGGKVAIEKRLRATRVEGGRYQEGRCRNSICLLDRIYIPRPFHFALRPYDRYSLYLARFMANPRRASLS